jgi:hypothetical protein
MFGGGVSISPASLDGVLALISLVKDRDRFKDAINKLDAKQREIAGLLRELAEREAKAAKAEAEVVEKQKAAEARLAQVEPRLASFGRA